MVSEKADLNFPLPSNILHNFFNTRNTVLCYLMTEAHQPKNRGITMLGHSNILLQLFSKNGI